MTIALKFYVGIHAASDSAVRKIHKIDSAIKILMFTQNMHFLLKVFGYFAFI